MVDRMGYPQPSMHRRRLAIFLGIALALLGCALLWPAFRSPTAQSAQEAEPDTPWDSGLQGKAKKGIFNTTIYSEQPAFSGKQSGMREDLKIIYPFMGPDFKGKLWGGNPEKSDDDLKYLVRQAVELGVTRILLDVEAPDDATRNARIVHMSGVIKSIAPDMLVGNYAYPRNYFPYTAAQNTAANDAAKEIMAQLDFGCGVAYTSCAVPQELAQWKTFVRGILSEGRRLMPGKEQYVLLNVAYSDYGWRGPQTATGALDPGMLVEEIKSCFAMGADGVVIWGCTRIVKKNGNDVPAPWDAKDPWYQAIEKNDLFLPNSTTGTAPATATSTAH